MSKFWYTDGGGSSLRIIENQHMVGQHLRWFSGAKTRYFLSAIVNVLPTRLLSSSRASFLSSSCSSLLCFRHLLFLLFAFSSWNHCFSSKFFAESVIGAAGVNTGAVGVDAKLIVVLESVELNFPKGWVISAFQGSYSNSVVDFCVSSVILYQLPSYHVGIVTLGC